MNINELFHLPLIDLIAKAHAVHKEFHPMGEIQVCSLISIKTGGCPENCSYCAQSSHYQTGLKAQPMMDRNSVISAAKSAIEFGADRICLGAAWRNPRDGRQFDEVLKMITEISEMGVEVCCTLGMLTSEQASRLKEAGLHAYNHNLDTSENHYKNIVTTRTYADRLRTLDVVEEAGLSVCCGGIIGLGETTEDRIDFLQTLSKRNPQPESVPINCLGAIPGTPLENEPKVSIWELVRMVAVARILMPRSMVRLSAGRMEFSFEQQALCFLAGANSIFSGEKLLTIGNQSVDRDVEMFQILGLKKRTR